MLITFSVKEGKIVLTINVRAKVAIFKVILLECFKFTLSANKENDVTCISMFGK